MTYPKNRNCFFLLNAIIALAVLSQSSHATKLYKWVDKDGNISYQDSPPPKNSKVLKEQTIEIQPTSRNGTASVVSASPVVIYTLDDCNACQALVEKFSKWNVRVTENSLRDRQAQARVLAASGGLKAPSLFIGGQYVSDLSEAAIVAKLRAAGYELTPIKNNEPEPRNRRSPVQNKNQPQVEH